MNHRGRSIVPEDRKRLLTALTHHDPHAFERLRTGALIRLAWTSALRVSECLALDCGQLVEEHGKTIRIRSSGYLRTHQAKGAADGRWSSAGQFVVTLAVARALRLYILEARRRGWLSSDASAPIFIAHRRTRNSPDPHGRLTHKGARAAWYRLQRRAGLQRPLYRFHDLRHDAITRFADACKGDAFKVAQFGRIDVRTASRYVHTRFTTIAEIADVAMR